MAELERFEIKCASRGFHIYGDIWKPKPSQLLEVFHEQGNIHDPFAMAFAVKVQLCCKSSYRPLPREIYRFCPYFMDYGGVLVARVRDSMQNLANSEQRSWDIRNAYCEKGSMNNEVFRKMKHLLEERYMEPDLGRRRWWVKRWWGKWRVCSSWRRRKNKYSWG